jgi:hypothetical protein
MVPAGSRDRNHPVGPINRLIVLRQRDIIDRFAPRRHSHRYPKGGLRAIEGSRSRRQLSCKVEAIHIYR